MVICLLGKTHGDDDDDDDGGGGDNDRVFFLVGERETFRLCCETAGRTVFVQKNGAHCSAVLRHERVSVARCIVLRRSSPETRAREPYRRSGLG